MNGTKARILKCETFEEATLVLLRDAINDWFAAAGEIEFVEIQYQTVPIVETMAQTGTVERTGGITGADTASETHTLTDTHDLVNTYANAHLYTALLLYAE